MEPSPAKLAKGKDNKGKGTAGIINPSNSREHTTLDSNHPLVMMGNPHTNRDHHLKCPVSSNKDNMVTTTVLSPLNPNNLIL